MKFPLLAIFVLLGVSLTVFAITGSPPSAATGVPSTPLSIEPHAAAKEEKQQSFRRDVLSTASPPSSTATTTLFNTPPPSGEDSPLRAKTLELAGAFSNDGYKIRDGFWISKLPPIGKTSYLAVNLFAGNQYWFCVATTPPAQRISLKLYNESGQLVSSQLYEKNLTAALGVEASNSGKYYLGIQLQEGKPTNFCVLYTYK